MVKQMDHNSSSLFPLWSSLGDITKKERLNSYFFWRGENEEKTNPTGILFPELFSYILMTESMSMTSCHFLYFDYFIFS